MPKTEAQIQGEISKLLKSAGFSPVYKIMTASVNGVPDIFALWHGHSVHIEVKKHEFAKHSPEQECMIDIINDNGGIAFFSHSKSDCVKKLKARGIDIFGGMI